MAETENKYEVVIIFNPDLNDTDVTEQIGKIEGIIKAHQGAVLKQDVWGRRQLAYRLKKKEHGYYVLLIITGDNQLVADLDRQLRINEKVLRHLIVKKDKYAPDSTPRLMRDDDDETLALIGPVGPHIVDDDEELGAESQGLR